MNILKWFKRKKSVDPMPERPIVKRVFKGGPLDEMMDEGRMVSEIKVPFFADDLIEQHTYKAATVVYKYQEES